MRVLLTGLTGLAGAAIGRALLGAGVRVVALTRRPLPPGWDGVERLPGDLRTLESVPAGIDALVHAAALHSRRRFAAVDFAQVNVRGTANLLEACRARDVGTVVFVSTLSVYGRVDRAELTEDTPCVDPDAYGLSKLMGERLLADVAAEVRSVSLRLPGILGPGATDHWLAGLVGRAARGAPIRIFNPDAAFNNAIDREDLAEFVVALLRRRWTGAEALNLACAAPMRIGDIAARTAAAFGGRSEILVDPPRASAFTVSTAKAEARFGFVPRRFDDALDRYLAACGV